MRTIPPPPETTDTDKRRVCCDGGEGVLGHQRIWLQIGQSGWVDCPYCDRRFQLDEQRVKLLDEAPILQRILTVSTSST